MDLGSSLTLFSFKFLPLQNKLIHISDREIKRGGKEVSKAGPGLHSALSECLLLHGSLFLYSTRQLPLQTTNLSLSMTSIPSPTALLPIRSLPQQCPSPSCSPSSFHLRSECSIHNINLCSSFYFLLFCPLQSGFYPPHLWYYRFLASLGSLVLSSNSRPGHLHSAGAMACSL